jgi:sodium pump decarboxylase gamma subunit
MDEMMLSWGEVWTVVLSGISIVFVVLCILIAVVWTYGQIFHTINKHKSDKNNKKAEDKTETSSLSDESVSAQPISDGEIPTGVIAAITAAVAAFTGGKGIVTGIKKKTQTGRRKSTEWGYAGTVSAMKKLNRVGR